MIGTKRPWLGWPIGMIAGALLLAGCGASSTPAAGASTPAAGASTPAAGASTAPASAAPGGNGAADNSTSKITDVCSVVTKADLDTAFGGSWDIKPGSAPLTCDFDLTGNESSSALKPGSAVEIVLGPNAYATFQSRMALAQRVDGLGEQASVLGNTLFIKRGADVIEVLTTPYDGSPKAQAAMVALGKAIYPRF
jgi:hypothetical protein